MEKPTAFKHWINPQVINSIADEIFLVYPQFNKKDFSKLSSQIDDLELKERVLLITQFLKVHLPDSYPDAIKILYQVIDSGRLQGFSLWPFSEYIAQNGLNHFDVSMKAMYLLTQKFTAEFAIRPYFIKDHKKVIHYFNKWALDSNHHVRRWISEGSRPLLPWGQKLQLFVQEPQHGLKLLEKLKYDDELYVRKSVANHLNDISKHHPDLVVKTLASWEKSCPPKHLDKISWIKRHALRTLIKKGNPSALGLMGVKLDVKIKTGHITLKNEKIKIGDNLEFNFVIQSLAKKKQKLVIDYLIYYVKANKSLSAKTYKLKTIILDPGEKVLITKTHSLRPITTMVFYSGEHKLSIQINGKIRLNKLWKLN